MRIDVNKIPPEGGILEEDIEPSSLDLDSEIIKVKEPVHVKAEVSRITNTVTVNLELKGSLKVLCGRCLGELTISLKKRALVSYPLNKMQFSIDLDPDIREEIILDYPIAPLCRNDCRGLCPKCGENLNKGKCACVLN